MKKLLTLAFIIIIQFSGCIDERTTMGSTENTPVVNMTTETPAVTATPGIDITMEPTPVVTAKPETEYEKFVSWLETDGTDKHPYTLDNSKVYGEQYVCSQFTMDFMKNATGAGFEVYAVGLTGAVKGQNAWHMLAAVILDKNLYFVDPQVDKILKKEDMFHAYGYEYAYFGKEVTISRNEAEVSMPVYYHQVIGLSGQNYLYLKGTFI